MAIAAALVFAVVVSRAIMQPSPLVWPLVSRAGKVGVTMACAVVVVTAMPEFTHKTSKNRWLWLMLAAIWISVR